MRSGDTVSRCQNENPAREERFSSRKGEGFNIYWILALTNSLRVAQSSANCKGGESISRRLSPTLIKRKGKAEKEETHLGNTLGELSVGHGVPGKRHQESGLVVDVTNFGGLVSSGVGLIHGTE